MEKQSKELAFEEITNRNLVVLGAGESGTGAAILGKQKGWKVWVSDNGPIPTEFRNILIKNRIPFEENQHSSERILAEAALVVKSPGIPDKVPLVKAIKANGIQLISEIEFAYRYTNAFLVAITGSNGKTTTANLTWHLLKEGGFDAGLAGNVGESFAGSLAKRDRAIFVLELSSFQLDGIDRFCPDVAILLNISPDHLDRYDYKLKNYAASKFRILENQQAGHHFIFNKDDPTIKKFLKGKSILPKKYPVTMYPEITEGRIELEDTGFDTRDLPLKGSHNIFNASCAIQAAAIAGMKRKDTGKALKSFKNDPHRLEPVAVIKGVEYINDSKATNVDSVYYALEAMEKPLIWIVGGVDKGNDYSRLNDLVEQKVKAIICLGLENDKIIKAFSGKIKKMIEAKSAKQAVNIAAKMAEEGDVVLLSPACSSFDLFKNYKDRGDQFKAAVKGLN